MPLKRDAYFKMFQLMCNLYSDIFNLLKLFSFIYLHHQANKCNKVCLKLILLNLIKKSIVKKILVLLD